MNSQITKTLISLLLALSFSVLPASSAAVSVKPPSGLIFVRTIDTEDLFNRDFFIGDNPDLTGVGFPPKASTLIMINQPPGSATFVLVTPPKNKLDQVKRTPVVIPDSINSAYDSVSHNTKQLDLYRLFLLDAELGELIAIKAGPRNVMNPSQIKRFKTQGFGLVNPQGMTLDPASGQLFVLDGAGPRVVGIQPQEGQNFNDAEVTSINLGGLGLVGNLRGIAFNASGNYLYLLSTEKQKLYKITLDGDLVTAIDLSGLNIVTPQGMIIAPSLDRTDHPSISHLYLVTGHAPDVQLTEWALP